MPRTLSARAVVRLRIAGSLLAAGASACATSSAPRPAPAAERPAPCDGDRSVADGLERALREGRWEVASSLLGPPLAACGPATVGRARLLALGARAALDRSAYHRRDVEGARRAVDRAVEAARTAGRDEALAPALFVRGRFLYGRGFEERSHWTSAGAALAEARDAARRAGDARTEAEALFYLGLIEQQEKRDEPAERLFREARSAAGRDVDPFFDSFLERHLAALADAAGWTAEAERRYRRSLDLRESAGATVFSPFAMLALADFLAKRPSAEAERLSLLERAASVARSARSHRAAATALLGLADALSEKAPDAARDAAEKALESARLYGDAALVSEAAAALERLRPR